jgi:hypothetical protein
MATRITTAAGTAMPMVTVTRMETAKDADAAKSRFWLKSTVEFRTLVFMTGVFYCDDCTFLAPSR